jgi:lysophospholipase
MLKPWGRKVLIALASFAVLALFIIFYNPNPLTPEPTKSEVDEALFVLRKPKAQLPPSWIWAKIPMRSGGYIRYGEAQRTIVPPRGLITVIYIPGFTSMVEQYAAVLTMLEREGVRAVGLDLPGQGGSSRLTSHPQKAWVDDFTVYTQAVTDFIREQRRQQPDHQIVLIGESLGGHVATRAALAEPGLIDKLVLVAPALQAKTGGFPRWLAQGLSNVKVTMGAGQDWAFGQGPRSFERKEDAQRCGADPGAMALYDAWNVIKKDQRVGGATNGWLAALFRSETKIADAGKLTHGKTPVLLISPQQDSFVEPKVNEELCKASGNCRTLVLPKGRHCPWFDGADAFGKIQNALMNFIDAP